jgi:hypothetical protein
VTPDRQSAPPEGGWESLKVDELKQELEARGLPKSGTKAELIARLADDDVAQAGSAPATAAEKEAETPEPETPEPDSEEAQEASEDAAAASDADEEAAEKQPKSRRRGSAETGSGATRGQPAARPEGELVVRARARYVRSAPRKARLVMNHIRGKRVEHAQAILSHAPRAVSGDIL